MRAARLPYVGIHLLCMSIDLWHSGYQSRWLAAVRCEIGSQAAQQLGPLEKGLRSCELTEGLPPSAGA